MIKRDFILSISASFIPTEQSPAAVPPSHGEVRNTYAARSQLLIFKKFYCAQICLLKVFDLYLFVIVFVNTVFPYITGAFSLLV